MSDDPTTAAEQPRRGLGERVYGVLFRFLGPAQLGSQHQPPTQAADDGYGCPVCGHPIAEHTWSTGDGRRRMTCPGPPLRARS